METFTPAHGRALRRERLRQLIDGHGLAAVVLRRLADFAWYTGGGDSRVEHAAPDGVADLVVTADDDFVVTSTIEAPRMRSEQALGYEVLDYAWWVAACEEILARMRDEATRPGRTLGEAFEDCTRFYAEAGFPDEWKLHHQGGSSGYGSREVIATPASRSAPGS
jgi:Xaa-Pro aminopeptidase